MNEATGIGIATSGPQQETPQITDFAIIKHLQMLIATGITPKEILKSVLDIKDETPITPLSEIGLNYIAIQNLIRGYYNKGQYDEGLALLKDVADILVFGLDNEFVFEKYINILILFNLKYLRFSISWQKILNPDGTINETGIQHYAKLCELLKVNDIEPIVNLTHYELHGYDIHSREFEYKFREIAHSVVEALVKQNVKYWIAFNEPAVHSAGLNFGIWKKGSFFNMPAHFKTLKRIGDLSKDFYQVAHDKGDYYNVDVKVIANFNVALFDLGVDPTTLDKIIVWFADKIDKNAQINPYTFKDGTRAFDILALQPYHIYNFALVNKFLRTKVAPLLASIGTGFNMGMGNFTELIPEEDFFIDTSNPDFKDNNKTRKGAHGQILYPEAILQVIMKMRDDLDFHEFIITESGADIYSQSPEGTKDKTWYLNEVFKTIKKLQQEGISIPIVLIWTLIRMWEILGPKGGGIGLWDFAIFGEPLNKDEIALILQDELEMDNIKAKLMASRIIDNGNTPLRIYDGMLDNLSKIFESGIITLEALMDALVIKDEEKEVSIVQLCLIKQYYIKKEGLFSDNVETTEKAISKLLFQWFNIDNTQPFKSIEEQ
ncbi:MAG: family 1 glycosylhydrolase [Candidatus Dojkabacteria bacterium]